MECLAQEPVLFEDVLCQLHDMIQPEKEGSFTLRDLKRSRSLAGTLFNILFNLNKFIAFETRDPFVIRQVRRHTRAGPAVPRVCAMFAVVTCVGAHSVPSSRRGHIRCVICCRSARSRACPNGTGLDVPSMCGWPWRKRVTKWLTPRAALTCGLARSMLRARLRQPFARCTIVSLTSLCGC